MADQPPTTLDDFYREIAAKRGQQTAPSVAKPSGDIGHFGVFDLQALHRDGPPREMPYNRRTYYKISLISGRNRAEYADKVIEVGGEALLFATPNIPYHWLPLDSQPRGYFCVFTRDFLAANPLGTRLDALPIFRPGQTPLFEVTERDAEVARAIFRKMIAEAGSDYAYRSDLLRTYLLELIHLGQKLQPAPTVADPPTAATRITALFRELLEREFTPLSPTNPLRLRTPGEIAERLSLHVNYLNQTLKAETGKTTSQLIGERIVQEAKVLLRHSRWSVSEIAYALGFEEPAHFSNYFKRYTDHSPGSFRG
ncbi:AraC family transcriptional regulator [Neolewinella xylanilytica]|uniref:AraC family transcriptional regulator n=1 Tax=Neolewinella xylanilytica TaxID=1514080 RepID=A0A2S6I7X2_9BACT|nr:helix-turn-helix transcriptional regulator [Neolewinella xylanilytica]PPK87597.1 AraC family transcriptional regulator [Neolewinella xylanilytica]